MTTPLLSLHAICRLYQNGESTISALDTLDLTIYPGEFVAIMGQSGSGKTTLMNIIGCLDRPTSGSYQIMGREVSNLNPDELAALRRETFGFVFQRYNLMAANTALENVEIPAIYAGMPPQERQERAAKLLGRLGLGQRTDHTPHQLSGGQQQRVAIARSLMNDPPLILADEPTGALDSQSGQEVMALLRELHHEGRTILLITHEEKVARQADRIIHILDGRISGETVLRQAQIRTDTLAHHSSHNASTFADFHEAARMAIKSLRGNMMRTVLTLLGVIIGVASVVAMLAVGTGSKQKVLDQIRAMGTNLLIVRPGAGGMRASGDIVTLLPDDAAAIAALPGVTAVLPERSSRLTVRAGNLDYPTQIQGTGAALPEVRDWKIASGEFFTERDLRSQAPVAVVGQTVARNLFAEGDNPVGQFLLAKNVPLQIIGVMAPKGASVMGSDQDDVVFVPYTTGLVRLFGKRHLSGISVKVGNDDDMEQLQDQIQQVLRARHRTEDFNIRNMASLLETASETQNTLTIMLATVATISLLVGGIGVMNIMLVSVSERTREIGVRMATGARRSDIMVQFNTESLVVCAVGGLLGLAVGFGAGLAMQASGMTVIFSAWPALLAFGCACLTGVIFGYLPARKAARLDPVEALASE